jgi:hypothetical protein
VGEWVKPFERYRRERMQALNSILDGEERGRNEARSIIAVYRSSPCEGLEGADGPGWWAAGDVKAVVGHRFTRSEDRYDIVFNVVAKSGLRGKIVLDV